MGRLGIGCGLLAAVVAGPAAASGGGEPERWYLDAAHGERAAKARLFDGRPGIILARTPRSQLFMAWRALHGRRIGATVGEMLMTACCTLGGRTGMGDALGDETKTWRAARQLVAGAGPIDAYLRLDRPGPNYTSIPTCYADAFDTAAATLRDRVAHYGAADPAIRAWLTAQDVVFAGCGAAGQKLPPLPTAAPAWLAADHAYQAAALALYDRRFDDAAARFTAIGHDPASPWQPWGAYLTARARFQAALAARDPATYAAAHRALDALAAAPEATPGRTQLRGMARALAFREQPAALKAELQIDLDARDLPADAAIAFRDLADLAAAVPPPAEMIAWMAALSPQIDYAPPEPFARARTAARAVALDRWHAGHDPAWLVAALSLTNAGDIGVAELSTAAEAVPLGAPAGLTARYHLVRLTLASAPAAINRERLDAVLALHDLSNTDRNLLRSLRAAVAADSADFARFALRTVRCDGPQVPCSGSWSAQGRLDGDGQHGTRGFGVDAETVIDRLPLADRLRLAADPAFASPLQLDLALTSWARAVQLQDDRAIDVLSRRLAVLLPPMAADFGRVAATPAGPDRRFAEFFILAKVPGIRTDFLNYTRPAGAVRQYGGYWTDWLILPRGRRTAIQPPDPSTYAARGGALDGVTDGADVYCLGLCGLGVAPLRLPDFAAVAAPRAADERGALIRVAENQYPPKPFAAPAGAVAAWNEMLAYIAAHPRDARAPEALHWLVHAGRWGGSHDHSGRRAFLLLKQRYPATSWAKRNTYYYD